MSVSKERIKEEALALFTKNGYERTSLNDIAKAVGIKKASLYYHFSGKDDLFFALFEVLTKEFSKLIEQMLETSKDMPLDEQIRYNFEEYIRYFNINFELHGHGFHVLLNGPVEFKEKLYARILDLGVNNYNQQLEDLFRTGMEQGIIKKGNPAQKVLMFRSVRDGLLNWIRIEGHSEECIRPCWDDFWSGVAENKVLSNEELA